MSFNVAVRVDEHAAFRRFETLMDAEAPRRAAPHGERALAKRAADGASKEDLAPLKARVGAAMIDSRKFTRGADLLIEALASDWGAALPVRERAAFEDTLARAHIADKNFAQAVSIYASFLEAAGDEASLASPDNSMSLPAFYADRVADVGDVFADALNHAGNPDLFTGGREVRLASSSHMASLGAFYAMRSDSRYAAAGLLASAYKIRKAVLGGDHQDTVQLTLILGPVYRDMGRLEDAEALYREAFHAQERAKGSNSPDLSLYIKLLTGVYEQQGRLTEAQALNEHMRNLFRDAFGAQRYAANQTRDRRSDINRPVSQHFVLGAEDRPNDLVSAAEYSVPVSKAPNIDEMKIRLAADKGADPREANLPARLAQLISLCRSESNERVSLRSGYRSYDTQHALFQRNADRGTVTPPGMSEHQTGLGVDIDVNGRFMRQNDRAYQCFEENAYRFGFILSYPPGNDYLPGEDSYEPWHWRYVGVQTAQLYREAGPEGKPQEFLAALPCYQERAASGVFPTAGEADICLQDETIVTASTQTDEKAPLGDPDQSARILNSDARKAQRRR
ncbi:MAG: D-alanyl-D-alanine carboxypeptidase family protein [Pseudomonadota bacterium]